MTSKEITKADLYADDDEKEIISELFGNMFKDHLDDSRKYPSNPTTPIKLWYVLKKFGQSKLENTRLVTMNILIIRTSLTREVLKRQLPHFINAGIISEHEYGFKGKKKETTYSITPFSDWDKDLHVDMANHIRNLRKLE